MPLEVDLTELPMEVRRKLHDVCTNEFTMQLTMAKIRQQKIAKFYADNRPRSIEGLGGMEMAIDPWIIGYLNAAHGRKVMNDPDFKKWLLREDDSFRVRAGGTKVMVGWAPSRSTFHKNYGHD